ncbi:MAG: DUF4338 domain-containing protein [Chloroflexota bacterium]|nr:DUF4338 domain-containing protein [Chloroflexota bacterium]
MQRLTEKQEVLPGFEELYSSQPPQMDIDSLREDILKHVEALRLPSWAGLGDPSALTKDGIRAMHGAQRGDIQAREMAAIGAKVEDLMQHFANGEDIRPDAIDPELVAVRGDGLNSKLFRLATLLWSVPVSKGYGRRMRYLVRDRSNGKVIGVFGLTDPVFNLRARDVWIGWNEQQRRAALVHCMDAYVVGAVPPYSYLLGGKLVASLIGSAEVGEAFARRYAATKGQISKSHKAARLVLVTVTSALGRSSLYNRLKLIEQGVENPRLLVELIRVGATVGFGHFHLSESLFTQLREVVKANGHEYADAHQYGDGPNWRIRLSRVGLAMLGLDPDLLRHGITREIFVMPLALNYRDFLLGEAEEAYLDRPTIREISLAAQRRWILPRANRCPDYAAFRKTQILDELRKY